MRFPDALRPALLGAAALLAADAAAQSDTLVASGDTVRAERPAPAGFGVPEPARALPLWSVAERAGLLPGVRRDPVGDALAFRGAAGAAYVVDGLRVEGTPDLPADALGTVRAWTGRVPARIGNGLGAPVEVETRADAARWMGAVEGIGSDGLDVYGHRIAAGSAGGAVGAGRLGFFGAVEYREAADADPRAGGYARVADDVLRDLQASPTAFYATGPSGEVLFFPVPGGLPPGTPAEPYRAGLDVPAGYTLAPALVVRSRFLDPSAFSRGPADNPAEALRLSGGLTVAPAAGLTLRLDGLLRQDRGQVFDHVRAVFAPETMARVEAGAWRLALHAEQRFGAATWMRLGAARDGGTRVAYDRRFTSDIRDVLFYGDVDGPAADVARGYRVNRGGLLEPLYTEDGGVRPSALVRHSFVFAGAAGPGYAHETSARTHLALDAGTARGAHRLEAGLEWERQTLRGFALAPYALARYHADGSVEGGSLPGLPPGGVARYEDLPFEVFRAYTLARYGYDYLGLRETDRQDVDAYFDRSGVPPVGGATDLAPRRPRYAAAYVQDALALGDLALEVGLRVEAYGSNAEVLFDPFAIAPLVRVRDLPPGRAAPGAAADWAVYFGGASLEDPVVGYRDLEGSFYDASGNRVREEDVTNRGGVLRADAPISEAYRRAPTRAVVLPRLGATFVLAGGTDVHLFYNGLAQAPPTALAFPSLVDLEEFAVGSGPIASGALRPERADEFGGGLRHRVGLGSGEITGFYRRYRDLTGRFDYDGGFPAYRGYASRYGATVYGATAALDLHLGALDALASATLSREPLLLGDRLAIPYSALPEMADDAVWMHALTVAAAYAVPTGGGPGVPGLRPLGGVRLGGVLHVRSGLPYRAQEDLGGIVVHAEGIGRAPAFVQLDLRAEKAVRLAGRAELAAALWVENVLGRENVRAVYPTSGRADDPADLSFPFYLDTLDPALQPAVEAQYAHLVRNPTFYGRPRQVRLGLALRY